MSSLSKPSSKSVNLDDQCPLCQDGYLGQKGKLLRTSHDILSCLSHFRDKKQEYFICLSIDSGQRLIVRRIVTIGLLDVSLAHPREVFAGPLKDRAAGVIIAHNHPSGDAEPSKADIKTTQQLAAAGQLLGIPLQDHIIISSSAHYSFRRNHLI
jgi:DNA repair protein RadC